MWFLPRIGFQFVPTHVIMQHSDVQCKNSQINKYYNNAYDIHSVILFLWVDDQNRVGPLAVYHRVAMRGVLLPEISVGIAKVINHFVQITAAYFPASKLSALTAGHLDNSGVSLEWIQKEKHLLK